MATRRYIRRGAGLAVGNSGGLPRRICSLTAATAALALGLSLLAPAGGFAADAPPLEYQVKAAFLLNFTKFVEWPASAFADGRSPLNICVLGEDPFGAALDQMVRGEAVNGRPLAVRRMRRAPEPKSCQVLYV